MKANEHTLGYNVIPTGFKELDEVFGGGLPTKKIVEWAGSWSVGKSTLAYQVIANAQRASRPCLLLDAERAYTNEYGALLGIDNTKLDLFRARTAEEYLDHIFDWIEGRKNEKTKKWEIPPHTGGVVVIDAIGALLPREEAEKTSESRTIGLQARIIGSFCRKIVPILDDNDTSLLVLNHTFIPLGQIGIASSGGKKLEYARSVWIVLSRAYGKPVKKSTDGQKTLIPMQLEIKKNKLLPNEGTKILIDLIPGTGFVGEFVNAPLPKKRGRRPKVSVV